MDEPVKVFLIFGVRKKHDLREIIKYYNGRNKKLQKLQGRRGKGNEKD